MLASPQGAHVQYMYRRISGWISNGGHSIEDVDASVWELGVHLRMNGEVEVVFCSLSALFCAFSTSSFSAASRP